MDAKYDLLSVAKIINYARLKNKEEFIENWTQRGRQQWDS
jgi:hypothetical protein